MNLSPLPIQKFFANNARPLVGGKLFTYAAGTDTKVATYIDSSGSPSNTNPIILDFRGECRLWLDSQLSYKFILSPPNDTDPPTNPIWTVDNITAAPQAFDNAAVDTGSVNNISLDIPQISSPVAFTRVVFKAANTNTGPMTLQINGGISHNLRWQNLADFSGGEVQANGIYEAIFDGIQWQLQGPTLQPTQIRTPEEIAAGAVVVNYAYEPGIVDRYGTNESGTTDMTSAIQTALNVANQSIIRREVVLLGATYLTGTITWPGDNITMRGASCAYSYFDPASQKTILKAKPGTGVVINQAPLGAIIDRQGNLISDIKIDGNAVANIGIDTALANIVERVTVRGCTTAGIRIPNFGNGIRIKNCALEWNTGWGLQVLGVSTTTYSVEESNISSNTLGGATLEAGMLVRFDKVILESNGGPGLRVYNSDAVLKGMYGWEFDTCWLEDNASNSPNFALVIDSGTSDLAHSPSRIIFRNCRFSTHSGRKWVSTGACAYVEFENSNFTGTVASDAITLTTNTRYMSFIQSANSATAVDGISATQMDNAIAQGFRCYSSDFTIKRLVGSGAPAAAFQNSWVNFDGGFTPAAYWFDVDGNVCLQGQIKSGTIGQAAFTLPVGYRPATTRAFSINSNGAFGSLIVNTSGTVVVAVGSNTLASLDGVCFSTG